MKISKSDILEQVKKAMVKVLNLSIDDISIEGRLKDNYGLDSMGTLTFLLTLEDFVNGFTIDPDTLEAEHLESVSSVVNYIEDQLVKKVVA